MQLSHFLFGRPLATQESDEQRIGPLAGVSVLGLDALASVAYGPEAMLTVLLPLGVGGLHYNSALTLSIVVLLAIVFLSYRQTIAQYPGGGGAYSVAKQNLGERAALLAAAALALDYVLNVAVAIAAGVGALVSIAPTLMPYTLSLCLLLLCGLTLLNLRGVRSTGAAFILPTWLFVLCLFTVIAIGCAKLVSHAGAPVPVVAPRHLEAHVQAASVWLLMHAFASGCTAMTGVEAVSNAVPIFRAPVVKTARRTLTLLISVMLVLLPGEALLVHAYQVTATPPGQEGYQSVLSQLVAACVGRGPLYYLTLTCVVAVLCFSANTSFADFPRLCRVLATDKYLPEAFAHRGRRLVYSHGILVLSALSAVLLCIFQGITDALIPLFAVGAFLAFTMSQAGMVAHWRRKREEPHARRAQIMNAAGTLATGIAVVIILLAKFTEGAWISVLIMGLILTLFEGTHRHYALLAHVTDAAKAFELGPARRPLAVVPLRRWDAVTQKALRLALGLTSDVHCVQVLTGDRVVDDLRERWDELIREPARRGGFKAPELIVLKSDYRALYAPLFEHVTQLERDHPDRQIAVIVPELIERRWYHNFLHTHAASLLKAMLLYRGGPQIVIVSAPWYLRDWLPERRRLVRS